MHDQRNCVLAATHTAIRRKGNTIMTTRNSKTNTTNTTNVGTTTQPVMAVKLALKRLDITAASFFVAKRRHAYLREAIGTRVSEETGAEYAVILVSAVERYEAERKTGGSSSHGGAKKFVLWLNDSEGELEIAAKALSEAFGREVAIERLYRAKKAEGAATGEGEGETEDESEEGEGDQE